jgi:homocysteine S-methyltransferase
MGSQLLARGADPKACLDFLNIASPELVRAVHQDYVAAGAELIETNTFGANRKKLERFDLAERVEEINRQGAVLARSCVGPDGWVAGSMGPLGRLQGEDPDPAEIAAIYAQQATALAEGGADLLIMETFSDLGLLLTALKAAKAATGLPVAAQMVFGGAGLSLGGRRPGDCLAALLDAGADVVGLNCGLGPQGALDVLRAATAGLGPNVLLSAFPNAGFPERLGDRLVYPSSPRYFAQMLGQFLDLGVRLVGGCCGAGPEHIRALREVFDARDKFCPVFVSPLASAPVWASEPRPESEGFGAKLGKKPMFLVELDPPKHLDVSAALASAEAVTRAGADAITVAENPLASPRLSNIVLASLIKAQTGIDLIVHLTGRDRNLIGMQSTIMGLACLGLTNVLAVTGDPPSTGGEERLTGVFDVRSYELISLLECFKKGRNAQGQDMRKPVDFRIGGAFNPNTRNIGLQVGRMRRKAELGAEYFLTQPVYSIERVDAILEATRDFDKPIFLGVMPLASSRNAEFLHNEFPGVTIPDEVRARMRVADEQGGGAREGVEIAWELLEYALPHFAGAYLMPPFNRHQTAIELMNRARRLLVQTPKG